GAQGADADQDRARSSPKVSPRAVRVGRVRSEHNPGGWSRASEVRLASLFSYMDHVCLGTQEGVYYARLHCTSSDRVRSYAHKYGLAVFAAGRSCGPCPGRWRGEGLGDRKSTRLN